MGGHCYAVDGYIDVFNALKTHAHALAHGGRAVDLGVLMEVAKPMIRVAKMFLEEDARHGIPPRPIGVTARYGGVAVGLVYVPDIGVVAIAGGLSRYPDPRSEIDVTSSCLNDYVIYLLRPTSDVLKAVTQVAELTPRGAFPKIPTTA